MGNPRRGELLEKGGLINTLFKLCKVQLPEMENVVDKMEFRDIYQ